MSSSALRFYETEGLRALRPLVPAGNGAIHRDVIVRVSFIRIAQEVGLTLGEIGEALASLPDHRAPTQRDWHRLATSWGPRLDQRRSPSSNGCAIGWRGASGADVSHSRSAAS